jgi:hypothetical protein
MWQQAMRRKMQVIGGVWVGLLVFLMASMAFATTLTGRIQTIRISEGTSPVRVSIRLIGTTACPTSGWFAYENAAVGLGLVQTQGLLAAYQSGQPVTIVGAETCDAFGVEDVLHIDLE